MLLEAGADINAKTLSSKQTPLLTAISNTERNVVDILLEYGADVQVCLYISTKFCGGVKLALQFVCLYINEYATKIPI